MKQRQNQIIFLPETEDSVGTAEAVEVADDQAIDEQPCLGEDEEDGDVWAVLEEAETRQAAEPTSKPKKRRKDVSSPKTGKKSHKKKKTKRGDTSA